MTFSPIDPGGARVALVSKPGCHLCDVAREVIQTVTRELGETFVEVNMLEDPDLIARYAEMIPVTFVDGAQHDYWRVSADRLRAALRQ